MNKSNVTTFAASVGEGYFLSPKWEGTGNFTFNNVAPGAAFHRELTLRHGPTYNFNENADSSFFATAQAGLRYYRSNDNYPNLTSFLYYVGFGSRFQIVDHVGPNCGTTMWQTLWNHC